MDQVNTEQPVFHKDKNSLAEQIKNNNDDHFQFDLQIKHEKGQPESEDGQKIYKDIQRESLSAGAVFGFDDVDVSPRRTIKKKKKKAKVIK